MIAYKIVLFAVKGNLPFEKQIRMKDKVVCFLKAGFFNKPFIKLDFWGAKRKSSTYKVKL